MSEAPRVVMAAVLRDGIVYAVERPGRHHHIIHKIGTPAIPAGGTLTREARGIQGFVLSDGRFADRLEAAVAAISSGQIKELRWPPDLFSEDLW